MAELEKNNTHEPDTASAENTSSEVISISVSDATSEPEFDIEDEKDISPTIADMSDNNDIPPKKDLKTLKKVLITAGIAVAVLAVSSGITLAVIGSSIPKDLVADNVYIEDLNVSGLSYDDLLKSIKATYLLKDRQISITCQGKTMAMNGRDIGIAANPEETAQKAFAVAKSDSSVKNAFAALGLKFKPTVIVPSASVDDALLDEKLNEFGLQVYGELKQPSVRIETNTAVITPGTTGYNNDPEYARGEVKWHIQYESFENIPVTLEAAKPSDLTVEELDAAVYKDPVNASYLIENNKVTITPSEPGRYLNKDEALPLLETVAEGGPEVSIPYYVSQPEVLESTLNDKLFDSTLASFSTYYGSSASGRKQNVAIAAGKLNGVVIAPGATFSFNDTVGKRSVANGFQPAPEYNNGESVVGIGGGTCQVSTTLFNSVLLADLDIVSRSNHSLAVHYVPAGRDATVADYGPDFKFRNNTGYPIKLVTSANGANLSISVVGTSYEPSHSVHLSVSTGTSSGKTSYTLYRKTKAGDEVVRDERVCTSVYK